MPSIPGYISTSCEDCRISLMHVTDIDWCRELLKECERLGRMKTRVTIVKRRIKQLEREVA
ncbi:MAG: hypothetical protein JZU65_12940 [Chlorobium sp.]|nr:hypothetical protein [Chlorobium sp.]